MRLRTLPSRPTAIALALWSCASAHAQTGTPADASTLPAVRVKASADSETGAGPVTGYNARRSGTATKTDTPLNEVPQSITVITADQIKDQNAQTMQEVLRYTAGVRADMYGLDNRGDWFTLRGGSEGSTLLNGLRLPLSGSWGVVRNEPYAFERIEVLRGPASVMAGQNGPGGVVNLVSKRPLAEARREVSLQLGNDEHKQLALDLAGPLENPALQYRLVALARDRDTQVEHAYDKRELLAPSLRWRPNGQTSVTVYAEYQHDKSGNTEGFFPIAGTLRPGPQGRIPYDTFVGEPDWDTYGGTRKRLGYEVEQVLSGQWTLRHNLRHDRVDGKLRTMYANWFDGYLNAQGQPDADGSYLGRTWYANNESSRITNADLLFEGRLNLGSQRHTVLLGLDAMQLRNESRQVSGAATPLNVYDPTYGTFPLPALDFGPKTSNRTRQVGLLAQDQVKFDERWVGVLGLRHDRARSEVDDAASQKDSATTKSLGVVYLADGGWSPYASYSESFEPTAGAGKQGAAFRPRRGKQVEAGVKWSPADSRLTATAAVYRLKETGRLVGDATDPNFSVQMGEVTVKGVELELSANLRAWELVGNYTYTDAQQTQLSEPDIRYAGKQLQGIPEHSAAAWAAYRFASLPGFKAGLGVRHVGKTGDGADTVFTPSHTLVDALVSYDTGPWALALNVSNLANKTYIATCLERGDCWYGTKRRAVATLDYRW